MPLVQRCKYKDCHVLVERPALCCAKHKQYEQKLKERYERYSRSRYNKYKRNRNEEKKEQYNFYRTKRWSSLRTIVLSRDNYICLYCLADGKLTTNSKIVDHIIPFEVNPSLKANLTNLATCCRDCHNAKTAWEREYYGTGRDNQLTNAEEIFDIKKITNLMYC